MRECPDWDSVLAIFKTIFISILQQRILKIFQKCLLFKRTCFLGLLIVPQIPALWKISRLPISSKSPLFHNHFTHAVPQIPPLWKISTCLSQITPRSPSIHVHTEHCPRLYAQIPPLWKMSTNLSQNIPLSPPIHSHSAAYPTIMKDKYSWTPA